MKLLITWWPITFFIIFIGLIILIEYQDNIVEKKDECVSYYHQNKPTSEDMLFDRQCGHISVRHFLEN
jgi:hypothetical protein